MSNNVSSSKFLHATGSSCYYLVIAERLNDVSAVMHFNDYQCIANATIFLSFPDNKTTDSVELTKDQITYFLSLDCPDAFIAYALTLCPCPPEIPLTNDCDVTCFGMDGGIFMSNTINKPVKVYPKKSSYLDSLKSIKKQIDELNQYSFEKSIISDTENYALFSISSQLEELISFDHEFTTSSTDPLWPVCPVCQDPVDVDQFTHNGGVCNYCLEDLQEESFEKSEELERKFNDDRY